MTRLRVVLISILMLCASTWAASGATARVVTRVIAAGEDPPPPGFPFRGPGYWVGQILIESAAAPDRPICSGDSIRVILRGDFPDGCRRRYRIELLPSLEASPLPHPPVVRFVEIDSLCVNRICPAVLLPWEARVTLPPLPARDYSLHLLFEHESCTDSVIGSVAKDVPFVVDRCGAAPDSCLLPDWEHPNDHGQCDAEAGPGEQAKLDFRIHTTVALAGLQGEFAVDPPALRITDLEPIGAATGMLLSWTPTERGAKFVLVSPRGAPIVPTDPRGSAVLRVTTTRPPNGPVPPRTRLTTPEVLGSTADGIAVPWCPPCPFCRFAPPFAIVCAPRDCDVNADGRNDVRDLVRMVGCLRDSLCGAESPRHFDCDLDSDFDVSDVICCARRMLRPPGCPDCPPDTSDSRPGGNVVVRLGTPVATEAGLDVPVVLAGTVGLGAARVGLTFPADRWEVAGVEYPHANPRWLALDDAGAGELALGWVQISEPSPELVLEGPLEALVHLRLKPGQSAAGEIAIASGEFSATDGVRLEVDLGRPAIDLGGPVTLELAANRPNPFAGETRFSVTLDRAANVELGVYDVGGRQVATIHRGRLAPGPHEFVWNGRDHAGKATRGGMYFYRATADGRIYSRKMVLLGTK